jgi:hypothetical protein
VSRRKRDGDGPWKACCMVSELLEEAGIDRQQLRRVRRQVLEGVILLCQWQLQRMDEKPTAAEPRSRARQVKVE